jgi:hypothetical protein
MAAPAFGALGARLAGASSTAANVSVPTTPAADANTLDVLNLFTDTNAAVTVTPPDGTWTQAPNSPITRAIGGLHREHVWWRRPVANSGTYNFTLSVAQFREGICTRLTGVIASGSPFDATTSIDFPSSSTATTAVSVTTTGADRLLLFLSTNWDGRTYTPPTGFVERYDAIGGGGGTDTGMEVATLAQAAAGSSGSVSATLNAGANGCVWLGAVLPVASAGTPVAAGFTGAGALSATVVAVMASLVDTFDAGIDAKWTKNFSADSAQVTASGGAVRIDHTAVSQYNNLRSVSAYNLTGSAIYVKIADFGNQTLTSHQVVLGVQVDDNNRVAFYASNNNLGVESFLAGVKTDVGSIALNTTSHRWLRIRESSGSILFDTSPDGSTWTNRFTKANPWAVTGLMASLSCGNWQNEATASYAIFDNVNTVPAAGVAVSASFTGTGALAATAVPRFTAAAAFTTTGQLTATVAPQHPVAAVLAGSGTLAATIVLQGSVTATLAGTGAFTAAVTGAGATAAVLAGSGTLTATVAPIIPATAVLAAVGALSATATPLLAATVALSGTGTLTATAHLPYELDAYPDAVFTVRPENTVITVKPENITLTVKAENTTVTVKPENRSVTA